MSWIHPVAHTLAVAFLAGTPTAQEMAARGLRVLGGRQRWVARLAGRLAAEWEGGPPPSLERLIRRIQSDPDFQRAKNRRTLKVGVLLDDIPRMKPSEWEAPSLTGAGEVASWLEMSLGHLFWLADIQGRERHADDGPLRNYHYQWRTKRAGDARLIESPKPRLKAAQRQTLRDILDRVPPHDAAHGFRRGRSILTFVQPHVRRHVVVKMDLRDFFPSIFSARINSIFSAVGFPHAVSRILTGLCCNATPMEVLHGHPRAAIRSERWRMEKLYAGAHLPQGAPTSPALANLSAYRLDCRLSGLAGASGAQYTRYADDLVFSGDISFSRGVKRFVALVGEVVDEEGFSLHDEKTRFMRQGVCQRVAGLTLNQGVNFPRREYDLLKATLHHHLLGRAPRSEFDSLRSHLLGRVAFVESVNVEKGRRLRAMFEQIQ